MIRLLKTVNSKKQIVGYEYKCNWFPEYPDTIIETSHKKEPNDLMSNVTEFIRYDSFNLGFKFGDKWIFEGDKVEMIKNGGYTVNGVVEYEELIFTIGGWYLPKASEIHSITVTGNIYEASHDGA